MTKNSFDIQELTIFFDNWKVDLHYESWNSPTKMIEKDDGKIIIELSEKGEWDSALKIDIADEKLKRTCIVTGIQGGTYLHTNSEDENGQSVKIDNDNLILSLGLNFISINLIEIKLNWKLEPDMAVNMRLSPSLPHIFKALYLCHEKDTTHSGGNEGSLC